MKSRNRVGVIKRGVALVLVVLLITNVLPLERMMDIRTTGMVSGASVTQVTPIKAPEEWTYILNETELTQNAHPFTIDGSYTAGFTVDMRVTRGENNTNLAEHFTFNESGGITGIKEDKVEVGTYKVTAKLTKPSTSTSTVPIPQNASASYTLTVEAVSFNVEYSPKEASFRDNPFMPSNYTFNKDTVATVTFKNASSGIESCNMYYQASDIDCVQYEDSLEFITSADTEGEYKIIIKKSAMDYSMTGTLYIEAKTKAGTQIKGAGPLNAHQEIVVDTVTPTVPTVSMLPEAGSFTDEAVKVTLSYTMSSLPEYTLISGLDHFEYSTTGEEGTWIPISESDSNPDEAITEVDFLIDLPENKKVLNEDYVFRAVSGAANHSLATASYAVKIQKEIDRPIAKFLEKTSATTKDIKNEWYKDAQNILIGQGSLGEDIAKQVKIDTNYSFQYFGEKGDVTTNAPVVGTFTNGEGATGEKSKTLLYGADGYYKLTVSATATAGKNTLSQGPDVYQFKVDTQSPKVRKPTYSGNSNTRTNATTTKLYFKNDITLGFEATDNSSGVDRYEYAFVSKENTNAAPIWHKVTASNTADVTYLTLQFDEIDGFSDTQFFEGKVYVKAIDEAENESETSIDESTIVILDKTIGKGPIVQSGTYQAGTWTNQDITLSIDGIAPSSGIDRYQYTTVDKVQPEETDWINLSPENGVLVNTLVIKADTNANYRVRLISNTGMPGEHSSIQVKLQKTRPNNATITITPAKETGENGWFTSIPAIQIEPPVDAVKGMVNATVTTHYTFWDENKKQTAASAQTVSTTKGQAIPQLAIVEDGIYHLNVWTTDAAGNASEVQEKVMKVDTSKPEATVQVKENEQNIWSKGVNTISFGVFFRQKITMTIQSDSSISGTQSVFYQKVKSREDFDVNGEWTAYSKEGITSSSNEKYVFYAKVKDNAGNVKVVNSEGIIVDTKNPTGEATADITIEPTGANEQDMYQKDIPVRIAVVDPNDTGKEDDATQGVCAGIKSVAYRLIEKNKVIHEDTLFTFEKTSPTYEELIKTVTKNITIDAQTYESNALYLQVIALDNAGNTTTTSKKLIIDVTKPAITVAYDNNSAENETYYKEGRVGKISITEKNFDANKVSISIHKDDKATTAYTPTWSSTGNIHTATIHYADNGEYTVAIAYTDQAGNVADYSQKDTFTVDKIRPTIQVSYDNNQVKNQRYYKEQRKATIAIEEHNWNEDAIVTILAQADGQAMEVPNVSGWSIEGDTHVATVDFKNDGYYTVDISYKDKAGNESETFASQTFYIDTIAPEVRISAVEDQSANKGEVKPVVTCSDTNFVAEDFTIQLSGANRGAISKLEGSWTDETHGKTFAFDDFSKKQDQDDLYTLTATAKDNAGNVTEKTIQFSINRFGSVYSLASNTNKIVGNYIKQEQDIVIEETNVDFLTTYEIKVSRNDAMINLEEGTDYKVEKVGENKTWKQYIYTIQQSIFAEEGNYIVTLYSKDKASNSQSNTSKEKSIKFGVDKTAPTCVIAGITAGGAYTTEKREVTIATKDNLKLSQVTINIDKEQQGNWSESDIVKANGDFTFQIPKSNQRQDVMIECSDAAGNVNTVEVKGILVTSNLGIQFLENKVILFGTLTVIGGGSGVAGLTLFRRRKLKI